jgi:hypothetical protein
MVAVAGVDDADKKRHGDDGIWEEGIPVAGRAVAADDQNRP